MAHEIESMFFIGETPWHGLGQKLGEAPTTAEAIKQAGLAWRVIERPIYSTVGAGADGSLTALNIPSHKALIRETDGSVLGVVGSRYQPLQNVEAFNFFDPLVESGLVQLETAGSLRDGKRIWVLARIADQSDIQIVGHDIVRKYLLLSNSHDGTLAVRVGFTPVRVVCANTLAAAHHDGESQLIRLKHSKSVVRNLESLREVINLANRSFEATAEQYRFLATKQINSADLQRYVKTVLGHVATPDDQLSTRASNQIAEVIGLFTFGRGNREQGVKGTIWAAYNAVTEYLSHEAGNSADSRYNSLWFGENANRNTAALNLAVEIAKAA